MGEEWSSLKQQPRQADNMPLRLAILALPALALVPTIAPPRAPRAAQLFSVVERGTSSLEDTEGLGAEFEDALVDDAAWDTEESGDEDLLAGFDLEGADVGEIKEWSVTPREICVEARAAAKAEKLTSDLGIRFRFKSAMPDRAEK